MNGRHNATQLGSGLKCKTEIEEGYQQNSTECGILPSRDRGCPLLVPQI